jgi:hypothetical protein
MCLSVPRKLRALSITFTPGASTTDWHYSAQSEQLSSWWNVCIKIHGPNSPLHHPPTWIRPRLSLLTMEL